MSTLKYDIVCCVMTLYDKETDQYNTKISKRTTQKLAMESSWVKQKLILLIKLMLIPYAKGVEVFRSVNYQFQDIGKMCCCNSVGKLKSHKVTL